MATIGCTLGRADCLEKSAEETDNLAEKIKLFRTLRSDLHFGQMYLFSILIIQVKILNDYYFQRQLI